MTLTDDLRDWSDQTRQRISTITLEPRLEHIGRVLKVGDGVAIVEGLQDVRVDELLVFEDSVRGLEHVPPELTR